MGVEGWGECLLNGGNGNVRHRGDLNVESTQGKRGGLCASRQEQRGHIMLSVMLPAPEQRVRLELVMADAVTPVAPLTRREKLV